MNKYKYHINSDNSDDLLYVDYNLVLSCNGFDGKDARLNIDNFMEYNGRKYELNQKETVVHNFSNLSEKSYYPCLGHSKNGSNGRGIADDKFFEILDLFKDKGDIIKLLHGNIFSPVFVYGYGPDMNSDLLIVLMIKQISDYTELVANQYGLSTLQKETKAWNSETEKWDKILITIAKCPGKKEFHLIVPEELLVKELPYSASNFLYKFWRPKFNAMNVKNGLDEMNIGEFKKWIRNQGYTDHDYLIKVIQDISYDELIDYLTRSEKISLINRNKRLKKLEDNSKKKNDN
ncbi:hypothetical protein [Companilactobacillus sp. HBUAS59699]|uniref:hypothetical protein n=1 Tax=Companilactobacillus sp. HBUAS59699 TaxID=3109358 RepID=UPI002FF2989E